MNITKRLLFALTLIAAAAVGSLPASAKVRIPTLRMSTTTSTVDSGLLDYLLPHFEKKYNLRMEVISVGTGKALKLGESGDVDVVLVHARALEDKFVSDGFGVNRRDVMHNDFLIVGPSGDPAKIKGMKDAGDAFKKIASSQSRFISRADKSGTDIKEKELWAAISVKPAGSWFIEAGQGMGATLTMADELRAYTLTDRATYLSYKAKVDLPPMVEGDPALFNPYGVIAVNPRKWKSAKYNLAMKFIDWITSPEGQKLIGDYRVKGVQLFVPDAK